MDPASLAEAPPYVRGRGRRRRAAIAIATTLILALVGWFARDPLLRAALESTVALASDYTLHVGAAHMTRSHLMLGDIALSRRGDPVLDVQRIDVDYALRDLLPGGKRRYGLVGIDVVRPQLYVIRHKDGSYNIKLPQTTSRAQPAGTPYRLHERITNGTIELIDDSNLVPGARHERIENIQSEASIDSSGLTLYEVRGALLQDGRAFPIQARARIDMARGYASHHITSAQLPLRGVGNFLINSGIAQIQQGDLRNLDVRFYSLDAQPNAPTDYHLAGSARLDGLGVKLSVLTQPLQKMSASLIFDDDAIVTPDMTGRIGTTPLRGAGGMYDFAKPKFRLAVLTSEDLHILHRDFNFLRTEPLAGRISATCVLEGAIDQPLILADARAARVSYGTIPVRDFRATIAYHDGVVFAGDVAGSVGGVRARVAGRFLTGGPDVDTEVALAAEAPPAQMPYLDRIAPRAASHMTLVGAGTGLLLDTHGLIVANGGGENVSGLFALTPRGVGELAPFSVRQAHGRVDGAFVLDREHGTSALWADAAGLQLYPASAGAVLHGVDLPAFPPISGKFDGQVVGADLQTKLVLAGRGRARDATFLGVPIGDARANFAGPITDLALGNIDARGEFGRFVGHGALRAPGFAFDGRLDGTLQGMRRWTGDIGASGDVAGPISIISDGTRTLVQTTGVALRDAAVHGVGVRDLAGTFGVEPSKIVVYGAAADLSGGRAVARGDSRSGIHLSTGGIDAARLGSTGFPLTRGSIAGEGDLRLSGSNAAPSFAGGVAITNGTVSLGRLDGSALLRYDDGTLGIAAGSVAIGRGRAVGLLAGIDGSIGNVGAFPHYDLQTHVAYADLGSFADAFHVPIPYLRGALLGDVHLAGSGSSPSVSGTLRVPQGSVNGMDFADGKVKVTSGDRTVAANGDVTVGSTRTSFAASKDGREIVLRLDADAANLADFNDFFAAADTLAGTGSFHAGITQRAGVTSSSGTFDLTGVRYRRFPFGHASASWTDKSGKIDGSIAVTGVGGDFQAQGMVALPQTYDPRKLLTSAQLNLAGSVNGADLNVWLPALGYTAPILGRVNATGSVRGRYPALALDLNGNLIDGRVGAIPIDQLAVNATAEGTHTQLRSIDVAVAGVTMHGSGSFGVRSSDPLSINMKARTASLREVIRRVTGRTYDLDGSAEVHLAVSGNFNDPNVEASFNVSPLQVSRLVIPSVVGSASVDHHRVALRDATMNLPQGTITLSGTAPLGVVPESLPLSFALGMHDVGLGQFATLGPSGTKLQGAIDGGVQVRGTVSEPRIVGEVDLNGGAYSGPFETQPITGVAAALTFGETSVQLKNFDATIGGGNLHGSGTLHLPNAPSVGAAYDAAFTLSAVRLAFPGYGSGRGDGLLWLRGAPPQERGTLGGDLTISDASIPLAAFLKAGAVPSAAPGAAVTVPSLSALTAGGFGIPAWLTNLGLDMHLAVGDGVRIRSPILDLGGKGAVAIAGRLGDPSLNGSFDATPGGSLFLNRAFRLQEARVRFSPENGIAPTVFARATTQIAPAAALQPIDVTVTASGLIPNVKLSYASNPPYDEGTIVGLLFDATNLGASVGSLNAFAPATNILLPPNAFQQTPSGTFALSQEAANLINAQFTARLLAPIEQGLGAAFGLSDLAINVAPTGSVGVQARRWLGHNVSALYGSSLSYPYRMTFGLESRPAPDTSIVFTAFTQQGLYSFGEVKPDAYLSANPLLGSAADVGGTMGFTVNIQRRFK